MPKRRAPESSDSQDDPESAYKRGRRNDYNDYDDELEEIDSQATISRLDGRTPTPMILAQRTPSLEPLADRQPSDEGCSWSFDDSEHSRGSSPEINILDYLPGHDRVISIVGLPPEQAREIILRQGGTLPAINPQPHEENHAIVHPNNSLPSIQSSNGYGVNSQISDFDPTRPTANNIEVLPDHQDSDDAYYQGRQPSPVYSFDLTQSTGPNRNNTAETFVEPYLSQDTGVNNGGTQVYFFSIEDYNLPKEIFDKSFNKLPKTLENNILDLDFSHTLPMGLISIILYSYIQEI